MCVYCGKYARKYAKYVNLKICRPCRKYAKYALPTLLIVPGRRRREFKSYSVTASVSEANGTGMVTVSSGGMIIRVVANSVPGPAPINWVPFAPAGPGGFSYMVKYGLQLALSGWSLAAGCSPSRMDSSCGVLFLRL